MSKAINNFDEDILKVLKSLKVGERLISFAKCNIGMNDLAHHYDHVSSVIRQSQIIAEHVCIGFSEDERFKTKRIVAMGALLHDLACHLDRDGHHELGANTIRRLIKYKTHLKHYKLTAEEADAVATCILEHRASWDKPRTSIYSEIVAAADRGELNYTECLRRSYLYGRTALNLNVEDATVHACNKIEEKFGTNGYAYKHLPKLCLLATENINLLRTQAMDKKLGCSIITNHREAWEKYYEGVRHASE